MPPSKLSKTIARIGTEMVNCEKNCVGASTGAQGTPPRCLYLEENASEASGVVVVGLNPSRAIPSEIAFYEQRGLTYDATCRYLQQSMESIKYYARVKALLTRIGLKGSILWTEIAKCELLPNAAEVSLDMQRNCTRAYLSSELKACPEWPVIATGRTAFKAAALLATDRAVIGVPHPTGAWGKSFDVATGNTEGGLSKRQRESIDATLKRKGALWLSSAQD